MIKYVCDWCGKEIPPDQLLERGLVEVVTKTSAITGTETRVAVCVTKDGIANGGQYHVLCVLQILVHREAELRREKEAKEREQ